MGMWMKGYSGRKIFQVSSPMSRAVLKGSVPRDLWELPLPTVIVRQEGEAWDRPFVAVFEPYYKEDGSALRSIRPLEPDTPAGDFVGLAVRTREAGTQYILNHTDDAAGEQYCQRQRDNRSGGPSLRPQGKHIFAL